MFNHLVPFHKYIYSRPSINLIISISYCIFLSVSATQQSTWSAIISKLSSSQASLLDLLFSPVSSLYICLIITSVITMCTFLLLCDESIIFTYSHVSISKPYNPILDLYTNHGICYEFMNHFLNFSYQFWLCFIFKIDIQHLIYSIGLCFISTFCMLIPPSSCDITLA